MNLKEAMAAYSHSDKERFPSCGDDDSRPSTTFWADFCVADAFGPSAIRDTYKRCFDAWKDDAHYWTECSMVLNHKLFSYYESGEMGLAKLYNDLWIKADTHARDHFTGDDARHYFTITD